MEKITDRRFIRFYKARWRKAECGVCHCLLPSRTMKGHAAWHVDHGDGDRERQRALVRGHLDIEVIVHQYERSDTKQPYWRSFASKPTGWVTSGKGITR